MTKVGVLVDTDNGYALPPEVDAHYTATVQAAVAAGVTSAMASSPAVASAVAALLADSVVAPLVTAAGSTRTALDARYAIPIQDYLTKVSAAGSYAPINLFGSTVPLRDEVVRLRSRAGEIWYNVKDFGAVGDGTADDTGPVQAAINAALNDSTPADVEKPQYTGGTPVVYFPKGTYSVAQINIPGAVVIRGCGGGIYAASELWQRNAGTSILSFTADTDGASNCSVVEDMTFKSTSGTSNSSVAQIKCDATAGNSMYYRRCWFKTPEAYAIWQIQGNDIVIQDCTFDVAPFHAIKFGNSSVGVTDARIVNNTFFGVSLNCVELATAARVVISGNNVSGQAAPNPNLPNSIFVNAVAARDISIANNTINGSAYFIRINSNNGCRAFAVNGNVLNSVNTAVLDVTGTGVCYQIMFTGNKCESDGAYSSGQAFAAPGAGLQNAVIAMNSILAGGTTTRVFNMPDARTTTNVMGPNSTLRFTNSNNFANAASNGV